MPSASFCSLLPPSNPLSLSPPAFEPLLSEPFLCGSLGSDFRSSSAAASGMLPAYATLLARVLCSDAAAALEATQVTRAVMSAVTGAVTSAALEPGFRLDAAAASAAECRPSALSATDWL